MTPVNLLFFMLCTDGLDEVTACPTFAVLDGNLVVNLIVTDNSSAPASALIISATGLLDHEVELCFSLPVLPMEAVIFPSVVVVANESVTANVFTLEVTATNKLSEIASVFSANFSYSPCESQHVVLTIWYLMQSQLSLSEGSCVKVKCNTVVCRICCSTCGP